MGAATKTYLIEMPEKLHSDLKAAAAMNGNSMKYFIEKAIEKAVKERMEASGSNGTS